MTEVSLFYNHKALLDVLILIADESAYPDKIERYEDVVILKEGDKVIGVNIFNSLKYLKIKASGLVHSINKVLATLIQDLVLFYSGYEIVLLDNEFILGQVKSIVGELVLVDIGLEEPVLAGILAGDIKEGDYVEIAEKETRLTTGHKAYHYLVGRADYLIIEKDLTPDRCGTRLYGVKGGR